jgi:magnesium-transporting ATPase (P-type)
MVIFASDESAVTQWTLDNLNVEQARQANKENLIAMGGLEVLSAKLGVNLHKGLTHGQVLESRAKFGNNVFPESPMRTFLELFLESFQDLIIMILIAASIVSLIVGLIEHPATGWIEGTAILIAVFIVAIVTAGNNYTKELQFRALERSSQIDERCSVLRNGVVDRINPADIVVGDVLVLQAGDAIPADCIIADKSVVRSNESALTGEAEDIRKSLDDDCFLLSSCLLTEAEDKVHAMVIGE